ncbi:alpha,alpha-trehalose-phosphate synthase (UDP-forming) [Psychrobacter sp. DM4]|uniref:alpha,alpha-trehalose-phosphate synthase (UDP-forming) n=1 Tax=Psychrobacter sp. DM4 TaxID=3440637 RepID=UPI003F4FD6D2
MSRLIVLSNRVKMPDDAQAAGGLAVALDDILVGNSVIWMGWNGKVIDACDDTINAFGTSKRTISTRAADRDITYVTTALTRKQYQHFYCGFANSVLWLLLHERPDLVSQADDDYAGYQMVNHLFAQQLQKVVQPDDVIWVHDYHFLSVAYYCRKLGIKNRIGFFLHIPFAPLLLWQKLAQSGQLIEHLAHYDVLGTQTEQDKANGVDVLKYYMKGTIKTRPRLSSSTLPYIQQSSFRTIKSDRTHFRVDTSLAPLHCLSIKAYPIGINVNKIQNRVRHLSCKNPTSNPDNKAIKSVAQQIIAVDRIDYSKGLLERFSAYVHFLQQYPIYQNQLQLLQVACPSRLDLPVYQQLYDDVKKMVKSSHHSLLPSSCIHNGTQDCQTHQRQAIAYSEKVLNHDSLMRAFWQSDIGWVNSLKDGMNLVAKEYVAAQNPDNPGVLLLSKYAGAAAQMQAAVTIDPHQTKSMIQGLKIALMMPLSERKDRHQTLLAGLQDYDIHAWQQDFLEDLYSNKKSQTKSISGDCAHTDPAHKLNG